MAEGDTILISINGSRHKLKNLRRHPGVGFLVLDPANPMRYLEIRGDAEIADDPDYVQADKIGTKYGADLRTFDAPGESRFAVTIRPTRVHAVDLTAG